MHDIYCFREDKKEFGKNLKSLMEDRKMTVEELADKVGYGVNTINKWRSGERIPSLDTMKSLATIFKTTIQKLYLPNSYYKKELSPEFIDFINEKLEIGQTDYHLLLELVDYNRYLAQKMMFSFLSPKEKRDYKSIFRYYILTPYGVEKLNLKEMTFEEFHDNFRAYIKQQYGASLPYKIRLEDSMMLINELNKIIKIKYVKEDVLL